MELANHRKEVGEEIKIINVKFLGSSPFLTLQRGFGVWGVLVFCFCCCFDFVLGFCFLSRQPLASLPESLLC